MNFKANPTSLMEPIWGVWCVFWYAVYVLARLFLFGARICCAIGVRAKTPQKTGWKHLQPEFRN